MSAVVYEADLSLFGMIEELAAEIAELVQCGFLEIVGPGYVVTEDGRRWLECAPEDGGGAEYANED